MNTTAAPLFVIAILLSVCPGNVQARPNSEAKHRHCKESKVSYLWKLRDKPAAYVFGTIHVPHSHLWQHVPDNVKTVWTKSDKVYTELDFSDQRTQQDSARCRLLPKGQTLQTTLPADIFKKLRQFYQSIRHSLPKWVPLPAHMPVHLIDKQKRRRALFKAYAGNWNFRRTIWTLLSVNDLTEANVKRSFGGPIVDAVLLSKAKERGQETGALETAMEQCEPLNSLNHSLVVAALDDVLAQRLNNTDSDAESQADMLVRAYRCGTLTEKSQTYRESTTLALREFDKAVEKTLIVDRNQQLADRLDRICRQNNKKTLFFAVGVAHLLGNDSIVEKLAGLGYQVKRIGRQEKVPQKPSWVPTPNHGPDHRANLYRLGYPRQRQPVSLWPTHQPLASIRNLKHNKEPPLTSAEELFTAQPDNSRWIGKLQKNFPSGVNNERLKPASSGAVESGTRAPKCSFLLNTMLFLCFLTGILAPTLINL